MRGPNNFVYLLNIYASRMKNSIAFIVILCFFSLFSGLTLAQHLYVGARAGVSLANQSNNSLPTGYSNAINSGLIIGGEVDIPFSKTWSVCLQALYDQKGTLQNLDSIVFTTEQSPNPMRGSGAARQNFNYLEIPILFKAIWGSSAIRPYVFAGPSFGIFLSGSQSINIGTTGSGANEAITSDQPIAASSVNSPDISVLAGVGISLTFSSNAMLIADVSYALGLVNIDNSRDNTTVESRDIRLAAGILFPLN